MKYKIRYWEGNFKHDRQSVGHENGSDVFPQNMREAVLHIIMRDHGRFHCFGDKKTFSSRIRLDRSISVLNTADIK